MKRQPFQDPTFFRLTPGVRDRLLEINLTAAEWRIWCYLVSLDPFGDRGAKFVPAELMLKCKIKKTTYFSAKAKFQKLGLFDFRDGVTKVVNLQTSLISTDSGHSQQAKIIESEISESKFKNSDNHSEISESEFKNSDNHSEISESEFKNSESQSLKPTPSKDSEPPQTIKTYTDFKKTLSDSQREEFFNSINERQRQYLENNWERFIEHCFSECDRMPNPPTLPESFIRKHFVQMSKKFIRSASPDVVQTTTKKRAKHPFIERIDRLAEEFRRG